MKEISGKKIGGLVVGRLYYIVGAESWCEEQRQNGGMERNARGGGGGGIGGLLLANAVHVR